MKKNIFISYATKDKSVADSICSWLEKDQLKCWIAPRDITPGAQYGEAIINAINESSVMVIVFTEHSNMSKYVCKEVERAVSKGTIIVPVRFQNILPSKSLEFFLSSDQWIDAINPPFEIHLGKLTNAIKSIINNKISGSINLEIVLNDQKDIQLFNELATTEWFAPKQKLLRRIYNLFQDKS
jgi:TIR domain